VWKVSASTSKTLKAPPGHGALACFEVSIYYATDSHAHKASVGHPKNRGVEQRRQLRGVCCLAT